MNNKELVSAFEAVLFSSGEPVSIDRFTSVFELDIDKVNFVMAQLGKKLDENSNGFELIRLDNAYQLVTRKQYADYIRKVADMRRHTPLSQAAFEVLAVVAYNQPVTRAFIEQVRGVDCSGVITTLVEKNLIEETGRLELPGRPLLYSTTKNFLKCFSVSNVSELPKLPHDDKNVEQPDLGEQMSVEGIIDNEISE